MSDINETERDDLWFGLVGRLNKAQYLVGRFDELLKEMLDSGPYRVFHKRELSSDAIDERLKDISKAVKVYQERRKIWDECSKEYYERTSIDR